MSLPYLLLPSLDLTQLEQFLLPITGQIPSTNKDIFLSTSQHRLRHLCEQMNLRNFQDAKEHLAAGNQGDESRDFVTKSR